VRRRTGPGSQPDQADLDVVSLAGDAGESAGHVLGFAQRARLRGDLGRRQPDPPSTFRLRPVSSLAASSGAANPPSWYSAPV